MDYGAMEGILSINTELSPDFFRPQNLIRTAESATCPLFFLDESTSCSTLSTTRAPAGIRHAFCQLNKTQ